MRESLPPSKATRGATLYANRTLWLITGTLLFSVLSQRREEKPVVRLSPLLLLVEQFRRV